jgi:DNA-cytosine methyltransferase
MKKINALSLFDGMSCAQIALERAGIEVDKYYASEVDKYAIAVTQHNYPNTIQLGDVTKWREWDIDWASIDLLIGGSPCQGFSFAGKQLAFSDPRSKLFFVYADILNHMRKLNRKVTFLLENVKMKQEHLDVISDYLGVGFIEINSALLTAQNRERCYWTNIEGLEQPQDKNIFLKDILEDLPDCPIGIRVREKSHCVRTGGRNSPFGARQIWDSPFQRINKKGEIKSGAGKSSCLTAGAHSGGNHSDMDIIHTPFATRRYSVTECEALQAVPKNYTLVPHPVYKNKMMSNTQRYKMLGNGFTADVIAHILSYAKFE